MPTLPVIKRIVSLTKLNVFRDYSAPADLPDLRKYNLIYGFNGCGKTTLSRVFASMGTGLLHPDLPAHGTFEIELSDGSFVRGTDAIDQLKGRVFVFNGDFIAEHFRWNDCTANPVFYLGKEQKDFAETLEQTEAAQTQMTANVAAAADIAKKMENAFVEHKRDSARLIAEELGLGRKYDASNLSNDYANFAYDETLRLSESDRKKLRSIILQEAPLAKRALLKADPHELASLITAVRDTLMATIGTIAVKELQEHDAMLTWVKEGAEYHKTHDLENCLLCGHELTETRLLALEAALDDRFDELTTRIASVAAQVHRVRDGLSALISTLPSENDIAKEHRVSFIEGARNLSKSVAEGQVLLTVAISLLETKAATPNSRVSCELLPSASFALEWDRTTDERVSAVNAVIGAHNKSHDEFAEGQEAARKSLKAHYLADGQLLYRESEAESARAARLRDALIVKLKALDDATQCLRHEMRQHAPAADIITKMVCNYLGHKELAIGTLEKGYQLRRQGSPAVGPPSEGEKTAIVLCYFLVLLGADGRDLSELIVVLDDPISSLDTRALNYASSITKAVLEKAGQLIIMTHNQHFMNEAKKWLKNGTEKAVIDRGKNKSDATSTLLFIDTIQPAAENTRSSSIKEMPKYIREYESEYHYLFHLLLKFLQSPQHQEDYLFVMPNALRKLLDIFLAFKQPGGMGLSPKVAQLARDNQGFDGVRIQAIDRLVQLESHADNLDDLVMFSSMTLEETKDAAVAVLALMAAVDKGHHDQMCSLCRP